jgi:toxin ParE1/3/4
MKPIVTDPEVHAELDAAARWYDDQKEGLGALFLDAVTEAVAATQKYPKAFPLFRDTGIRKYVMRRFPYVIFFEEGHTHIFIYAFAHSKRRPGYWLQRRAGEEE